MILNRIMLKAEDGNYCLESEVHEDSLMETLASWQEQYSGEGQTVYFEEYNEPEVDCFEFDEPDYYPED